MHKCARPGEARARGRRSGQRHQTHVRINHPMRRSNARAQIPNSSASLATWMTRATLAETLRSSSRPPPADDRLCCLTSKSSPEESTNWSPDKSTTSVEPGRSVYQEDGATSSSPATMITPSSLTSTWRSACSSNTKKCKSCSDPTPQTSPHGSCQLVE